MTTTLPRLTLEGCLTRQQRLCALLVNAGIDAALITRRDHVHYLTGFWTRAILPAALLIKADGTTVLSLPGESEDELAADRIEIYESNRMATMVDNVAAASVLPLLPLLEGLQRLGFDSAPHPGYAAGFKWVDLFPELLRQRRHKDADEVDLIRAAVAGCEAAYARAREMLKPGVTEISIYAQMYAAACETVGEPIGEMGNDFRSGAGGGSPRTRPAEDGELMPLDVSIVVRGYSCDLCRTFAVNGQPTDAQQQARDLIVAAIDWVEQNVRAGSSCKALYQAVFEQLDGKNGWSFGHHLGHGIGLFAHEAPRLNPNWDDTLEVGDVFTVEPGLYGGELNAGIRIEQNYLVTEAGLERLSGYSTEL